MGWLFMPRASMRGHATPKAYLDAGFTYENAHPEGGTRGLKLLASVCPGNRVYYGAVQELCDGIGGDIFAVICLVRWNPGNSRGEEFGYKDSAPLRR